MKINLNGKPPESWHKVKLNNGDGFSVLVRQPTFGEKMEDLGMAIYSIDRAEGRRAEHRFKTAIVGWTDIWPATDDLNEKSEPVPFNQENLESLCCQLPEAADSMFLLSHQAFEGTLLNEEEGKNSEPLFNDSSADSEKKTSKQASNSVVTSS